MSDYLLYQLIHNELELKKLPKSCEDWDAVREALKNRGRIRGEQLVVLHDGDIYAVERADGDGFAMIRQDRQNEEDLYWYPKDQDLRSERELERRQNPQLLRR